jgi:peptidoglycan/xylan/chitin deacetylase (PgdA/CDA1 family)
MRRRRQRGAALVLLAFALAAAALITVGASGRSHHPTASQTLPSVTPTARAAVRRVRHPTAQLKAVQRLAARGLPLYCGGRLKRMVALTFDDGPGPYTRLAIAKLRHWHLRATFFLVGRQLAFYPRLARLERPVAAVGDHTMTHAFLPALSQPAMVQEIAAARPLIQRAARQPVLLFRPPYESHTPAIDSEVRSLGLLDVLWNVDSADSLGANYAGIERNVIAGLHPGSIILMHENRGQTIRALPVIFSALKRDHLRAVTIPELVAADPPSARQLRQGGRGCTVTRMASNGS